MIAFLQSIISGLGTGVIYAVIALGFSIVYKTTRVVNFAHGQYLVVAGILGSIFTRNLGWPMFVACLAVIALGIVLGVGTELVVFRVLGRPDPLVMTLGTVALGILLEAAVLITTGGSTFGMEQFWGDDLSFLTITVTSQMIWNVLIAVGLTVALMAFFSRTRQGISLQAAADDRETAALYGISPGATTLWSFALAGALGAIGGLMLAPVSPVSFTVGLLFGLKGFAAAMLGGLGSMQGALVGGIAIGLAETFTATYVNGLAAGIVAFVVLLGVLFFRPSGIFKEMAVERV
jgi:Branched-chain amino acid ABC-type transport system, permease components